MKYLVGLNTDYYPNIVVFNTLEEAKKEYEFVIKYQRDNEEVYLCKILKQSPNDRKEG